MTTTQKAFNQVQLRITELRQLGVTNGISFYQIKDAIVALEEKLKSISLELTAERYENNY